MKLKQVYEQLLQNLQLFLATDLFKFLVSGVLSVILEFFVLIFFVEKLHVNYLIANTIAFIITNIFNYALSRFWVFGKSNRRIRYELLLFFSVSGIGLLINQFVMWVLVGHYSFHYKLAKLFAIIIVVVWNFWSKKFLVFSSFEKKRGIQDY